MERADTVEDLELGATATDERSELRGATLVLRVIAKEFAGEHATPAEIDAANRAVLRVSNLRSHTRLRDLLADSTAQHRIEESWRDTISLDLMALAEELRSRGLVGAAATIVRLIVENSNASTELRCDAGLRLAFCLRLLGKLDEAAQRYANVVAKCSGPRGTRQRLEGQLGLAKVAICRGNIPEAVPIIESVIQEAREARQHSVLGKALIDRAVVAGIRRDATAVLSSSFEALQYIDSPSSRDRTFVNMAIAFRELGRADASRRLAHEVMSRPCDADQRAAAMILLYHLAIDAGDRRSAAVYKRGLDAIRLPPALLAERHEAAARDAAAHGDWDGALDAVDQMIVVADEHNLSELSFRGIFAAEAVRAHRVPAVYQFQPTPPTDAEPAVADIESKLDVLCSASAG